MDDMTKKASVPAIRFKGFTDAWEQCEFGEIVEAYTDPVPTPHNGYYRLGIRSHAKGTFHNYVEAGHELETAQMHRVAADKFIVNITFGWEHAVAITTENDADKLVSHRFPQFSFTDNQYPQFYKYVIMDEGFRHHLWLASPGGAGRNRVLKIDEMLTYKMQYPSIEEQKRIYEFFDHIDRLITLHQRKLDKLHNVKKSLLEKMFPINGADVPEIRFSGFTYAWEQYKLGQMCSEFQSGDFISADRITQDDVYPVFGGNGLRGYTSRYNHDGVYALIGRQGALCGNMNISYGKAYFTEHAVAVAANSSHDTEFLFYLFGILNLGQYSGQSAQPGLAVSKLITVSASTPKLNEQRQISGLLLKFDRLITLHQRKLEKLRQIKKALLEKMFV